MAGIKPLDDRALFTPTERERRNCNNLSPFEQGRMYKRALGEGLLYPSPRGLAADRPGGMQMIEGLIAGKVYGRPEQRVGNNSGKPFVTAKVRAATASGEALFVNVLAFDVAAQAALLALSDGDAVSLAGSLTPKVWTDREGQPRPALDMIASQVLTAYHVKRKREAVNGPVEPAPQRTRQPVPQGDYRAPHAGAESDADGWPASEQPWN